MIAIDGGAEKRLAVILRAPDGNWSASEWIWHPSEKPATRRWQEGRWQLLVTEAAKLKQSAPPVADSGIAALQTAWERNLGGRAGEIRTGVWQWQAAARCMSIDSVGVGQGHFRLPYLIEDSRLEQRAAMQLQLARSYPDAIWIKTFRPIPSTDTAAPASGAKYLAIWQDRAWVSGQLWIPTKSDGPVLRLRLRTQLAPRSGDDAAAAVERELAGLAGIWGKTHD